MFESFDTAYVDVIPSTWNRGSMSFRNAQHN